MGSRKKGAHSPLSNSGTLAHCVTTAIQQLTQQLLHKPHTSCMPATDRQLLPRSPNAHSPQVGPAAQNLDPQTTLRQAAQDHCCRRARSCKRHPAPTAQVHPPRHSSSWGAYHVVQGHSTFCRVPHTPCLMCKQHAQLHPAPKTSCGPDAREPNGVEAS
jgi:hypothetical protein